MRSWELQGLIKLTAIFIGWCDMVFCNQENTLIGQDFPVFLSNQNKEIKVLCPDGKAPYPGC